MRAADVHDLRRVRPPHAERAPLDTTHPQREKRADEDDAEEERRADEHGAEHEGRLVEAVAVGIHQSHRLGGVVAAFPGCGLLSCWFHASRAAVLLWESTWLVLLPAASTAL